jgi:hypothetical protein
MYIKAISSSFSNMAQGPLFIYHVLVLPKLPHIVKVEFIIESSAKLKE